MELEIYGALTRANVSPDDAKAVVVSIQKEIDKRYTLHSGQLVTRGDLMEVKAELKGDISSLRAEMRTMHADMRTALADTIKWMMGAVFAAVGLCATIVKLLG